MADGYWACLAPVFIDLSYKAWFTVATEATEAEAESKNLLTSRESRTQAETETSLSFKMAGDRHVFRSKSLLLKGLGMSYVIGWFFIFRFRFQSTSSYLIASDGIKSGAGGAGMAQWWERSPPTNVARVRFPVSASYVGWVCFWFSSLLREVFLRVLRFSPLLKNQHF